MKPASSHQEASDGGEETMEWHCEPAGLIPVPAEHANPDLSQIGVVVYGDGLFRDALIAQCAAHLVASGYRLGGVVQSNAHQRGRRRCDMYVKDLLGGDEIKISLDRGNEARGCRLDPDAFARIEGLPFLSKPFRARTLREQVARSLAGTDKPSLASQS